MAWQRLRSGLLVSKVELPAPDTVLIDAGVIQSGTLTRNSTAHYWDASSVLQEAAIDTARTDHDPADGSLRGLLVEEERENLVTQSEDLTHGDWNRRSATPSAFSTSKFPSAFTLTADAVDDVHNLSQTSVFTHDAGRGGYRFAAKMGTHRFIKLQFRSNSGSKGGTFDLQNGTIANGGGQENTTNPAYKIRDIGGGWYECSVFGDLVSANNDSTQASIYMMEDNGGALGSVVWLADGTETVHVAAPEAEQPTTDDWISSYIPTTTAAATREADNATDTIGTWPVPVSYEIVATPSADQDGVLYQADDGTENNRVRFERISGNLHVIVTNGGTEQCNLDLGALTDFTEFTVRAAFADNDIAASLNSGAVVTDTSATIPTGLTTRRYGKDTAGEHWNAWCKDADEFETRLTNSQLRV